MPTTIDPSVHDAVAVSGSADAEPTAAALVEQLCRVSLAGVAVVRVDSGSDGGGQEAARRIGTEPSRVVALGPLAQADEIELAPFERALSAVPDASTAWPWLRTLLQARSPAFFLDFDGTLSPIVDDPASAQLAPDAGPAIERLGRRAPLAVISGRDLADVRDRVGSEAIWYAGSHGFELAGPDGERHEQPGAADTLPVLDTAEAELRERLAPLPGVIVERKRFGLSAHYRRADEAAEEQVKRAVGEVGERHAELLMTGGRKVVELRPALEWDKGRALRWLLERLGLQDHQPVYAGDDLTDEDALAVVQQQGLGIVVRSEEHGDRRTSAHVAVAGPVEMVELLTRVAELPDEPDGRPDLPTGPDAQWWSTTD